MPEVEGWSGDVVRSALSHSPEGVVLIDSTDTVLFWNPAARDLLGVTDVEAPVAVRDLSPRARRMIESAAPAFSPTAGPVPGTPTGNEGVRAVFFPPVPALTRLQGPRREQQVAAGQLAAVVAKEIGAPLTAIQVTADYLLKRECHESQRVADGLEVILSQTRRIALLAEHLIHLAESGKPVLQPVDVGAAVREAYATLAVPLADEGVDVSCDIPIGRTYAFSDPAYLRQILFVLFLKVRALVAEGSGERTIRMAVRTGSDRVAIELSHSGPRISASEAQAMFSVLRKPGRGSEAGFDLGVVRHLLDEQRGSVACVPNEGGGATFHITLKRASDDR